MSPHSWWKCSCGTTMHYMGASKWHRESGEHDRRIREKIKTDQDRERDLDKPKPER